LALDAVLVDIARRGADGIVNGGDILSGPLWPAETAERLMALALPTIAGNHERQLLACATRKGGASDAFAFDHTRPEHRAWLASLPGTMDLGDGVYLCHGQPASDVHYLLETVVPATENAAGSRLATTDELHHRLHNSPGANAQLVISGHSHLPRAVWLAHPRNGTGGTLVTNAGSVGLQAYDDDHGRYHVHQTGSPHARYLLCECTAAGWCASIIAVPYDWQTASAQAARNGAPAWARWLATGFA
jgi:predicted phosphodiesterase